MEKDPLQPLNWLVIDTKRSENNDNFNNLESLKVTDTTILMLKSLLKIAKL